MSKQTMVDDTSRHHHESLARWISKRFDGTGQPEGWSRGIELLAQAEDDGATALSWPPNLSDGLTIPDLDSWPQGLWSEEWLVRRRAPEGIRIQTQRNANREDSVRTKFLGLVDPRHRPQIGQDAAVERAANCRLLILTGGPGTGKTTTLRRLIETWNNRTPGLRTVIAAPTGRAASRAKESWKGYSGGPECLTLHRLLGLKPGWGAPWHGPARPLPFDLVIVDEASMIDLRTAEALAAALSPNAALVLVGDPQQLPSVDPGNLLGDLISDPQFAGSRVHLSQRFRLNQGTEGLATVFDALAGEISASDELIGLIGEQGSRGQGGFRWIETSSGQDPSSAALEAWGPARGFRREDLSERILLSPVHRGPGSTEALIHGAQKNAGMKPGIPTPGLPWMITQNMPSLELANGDRGILELESGQMVFATQDEPVRRIPFGLVRETGVPAWAITVHKSQGSEFQRVVLVLPPEDSSILSRELLYTGLTRAKSEAILVASRKTLMATLSRRTQRISGWNCPRF